MANPIKGEVPLKLDDGREFGLVLDHEGLIEAESAYGKPLHQLLADGRQGFVGALRAILFGALRAKHPGATLRDASSLFMENSETVSTALLDAIERSFPDAVKSKEDGESKNPPRRGKRSGASGAKPA